jgi:hypothetical protein
MVIGIIIIDSCYFRGEIYDNNVLRVRMVGRLPHLKTKYLKQLDVRAAYDKAVSHFNLVRHNYLEYGPKAISDGINQRKWDI